MTDRELLEAAAKAAGMDGWRYASPYTGMVKMIDPTRPETTGSYGPDWNPLTDDGDALRLAVKLKMSIDTALAQSMAMAWGWRDCVEKQAGDPYAATRRAIVRAAAEVQP